MTLGRRRGLGVVLGFAALISLCSLSKPIHMDEPLFLAPARQILKTPLRPFDFTFNWYGREVPMAQINNTPPLMLYALAAALKATGGREWAMRLVFLPVDLLAAGALYLLAGVFLQAPLGPVLVVLACPGWLLNMPLLYPEKLAAALGLAGLCALALALEKGRRAWFWPSAVLCGAAVFSKYGAVFLVPTAAWYGLRRGLKAGRLALWCAAALVPIAAYLVFDRMTYREAVGSVWTALSLSAGMPTSGWPHKLRSMLAFTGGCGIATAMWPLVLGTGRRSLLVMGAAAAVLFLPALDIAPLVRPVDRFTGWIFACGALAAAWSLIWKGRRLPGGALWIGWAASAGAVQAFLYWSVIARVILFLLPPLVFSMAEVLEARLSVARLSRLYAATFAAALGLSAALSWVDWRYAAAQRGAAAEAARLYPGRRLWCAGHWGLQYYMEAAGARELALNRGGWEEAGPGDVVVVPRVNSNILYPSKRLPADARRLRIDAPLPLRLISGYTGEAGFYSNANGFLPFSFSREPLDEFDIVELRRP